MLSVQSERSNVDVILSRRDIEKIRQIINKEELDKQDISELFYLLAGAEVKVLSFKEYDRYLLAKFLTWVGEFVNMSLSLHDIKEKEKKEKHKGKDAKDKKEDQKDTMIMLEKAVEGMHTTLKYLVTMFLFISRSTLSIGGKAFEEFTKEKIEYLYPNQPQPKQQNKRWI